MRRGIVNRCCNKNSNAYRNYGARGITICDEWLSDIDTFCDWAMDNGWEKGLEIDRINNDGGYSPDNCRIVTKAQNMQNRGPASNTSSKYKGVHKYCRGWSSSIGLDGVAYKIGVFLCEEEAARAYDEKAEELFGEFAWLNKNYFPEIG